MVAAQASTGSQYFSSQTPSPSPTRRGKGCGSVLHRIAAVCWTISASARVDSTYRCWSRLFSTGRTATIR